MNLGGLAPELARARQQSMHGLERQRLQQQSELVQQKARQQRNRLEQDSLRLRTDIRDHKFVARERAFEDGQATRAERELIRPTLASHPNSWSRHMSRQRALTHTRRERASIASERASFDHEVRRREAAFRSYENEARRRATERESRPRQQRRASVVPPPLASQAAIAVFAAFEAAFERFEADVDGSELPMASLPWPPEDVPVSGVRRSDSANPNPYNPHPNPSPSPNPRPDANPTPTPNPNPNQVRRSDSDAARKARLKKALLRWHPDKYVAAHASRISASELAAVVERVTAVMQRVQQERVAYGSAPV